MDTQTLIDALRRELDGYTRRGMTARADAVRTELTRLGCSPGVTPREVVPFEPGGTSPIPATRVRKAVVDTEPPAAPKTPAKSKRAKP